MFNFPLESEQALQSPLIGVSFRVRLSHDFWRLSQMESLPCRLFSHLRDQQVIFLYYIKRLKQSSCVDQLFQNIYLQF